MNKCGCVNCPSYAMPVCIPVCEFCNKAMCVKHQAFESHGCRDAVKNKALKIANETSILLKKNNAHNVDVYKYNTNTIDEHNLTKKDIIKRMLEEKLREDSILKQTNKNIFTKKTNGRKMPTLIVHFATVAPIYFLQGHGTIFKITSNESNIFVSSDDEQYSLYALMETLLDNKTITIVKKDNLGPRHKSSSYTNTLINEQLSANKNHYIASATSMEALDEMIELWSNQENFVVNKLETIPPF